MLKVWLTYTDSFQIAKILWHDDKMSFASNISSPNGQDSNRISQWFDWLCDDNNAGLNQYSVKQSYDLYHSIHKVSMICMMNNKMTCEIHDI